MSLQDAFAAEAAAVKAYQENQSRGRRQRVMGIDVTEYAGYRMPGLDATKMLADPACILKDPTPGATYLWRKPDDSYTKSMVARQVLTPVTSDRIDKNSPYANIDVVKIITAVGPRQVVRTPGGLGLFEVRNADALNDLDKGLLPGAHWEHKYLGDLAEQADKFDADMETLSASSMQARVSGSLTAKDTQAEMIG